MPTPDSNYGHYTEWKGWRLDFVYSEADDRYFKKEFGAIVGRETRIIEIGFGSGSFLAWAKQQGAEVYGVELQDAIVEAARKHNFIAFGNIAELLTYRKEGFDVIVALDVLEHLSSESIAALFRSSEALLKPSGLLIARVPNGSSPFGRWNQNGDATHLSAITPTLLTQAAYGTKIRVADIRNQARVPVRKGWLHGLTKQSQFALRELLNLFIARVYGYEHSALDPNMVIVLVRKP